MSSFQYQIQYADQPQLMGLKGQFLLLPHDRTWGVKESRKLFLEAK